MPEDQLEPAGGTSIRRGPPRCAPARARRGAVSTLGSVSGSTPCPRLKMCPGRPPRAPSTSSAAASTRSHGPSSTAGSRLPWTPRSAPTASQPPSSGDAPVEADHVAAGARQRAQQLLGRPCRSGSSERRPRRGCAPSTARRTPRSPPATARRPTSRRAGSRRRRRRPARRRSARTARRASPSARATRPAPVHQRLRPREVSARLSLDEVAGDRERAAAEADERLLLARARARTSRTASRIASSGSVTLSRSTSARVRDRLARRPARRPRRARRRRPCRAPAT